MEAILCRRLLPKQGRESYDSKVPGIWPSTMHTLVTYLSPEADRWAVLDQSDSGFWILLGFIISIHNGQLYFQMEPPTNNRIIALYAYHY